MLCFSKERASCKILICSFECVTRWARYLQRESASSSWRTNLKFFLRIPAAMSSIFFWESGFWHKDSKYVCWFWREIFKLARRLCSSSSKVFCLEREYFSCKNEVRSSAVQSLLRNIFSRFLKDIKVCLKRCSSFCNCLRSERSFLKPPWTKIFCALLLSLYLLQ